MSTYSQSGRDRPRPGFEHAVPRTAKYRSASQSVTGLGYSSGTGTHSYVFRQDQQWHGYAQPPADVGSGTGTHGRVDGRRQRAAPDDDGCAASPGGEQVSEPATRRRMRRGKLLCQAQPRTVLIKVRAMTANSNSQTPFRDPVFRTGSGSVVNP